MAEALGNLFESDVFESYWAGTELKDKLNQDAVRIIKDLYNVDINKTHKSKFLYDIPEVNIVVKMGAFGLSFFTLKSWRRLGARRSNRKKWSGI